MKLLTLNVDNDNFIRSIRDQTDGSGDEVLFIDWIPTNRVDPRITKQIQIVESTPSDVRMIIFDRYSGMTDDETRFFLDRGSILLEPTIRPRPGFLFMPYYIDKIDLSLSVWDNERPFHIGYKGFSLSQESELWLIKSIKDIKNIRVGVSVDEPNGDREDVLRKVMIFGNHPWNHFNSTILTGSSKDYYRGVIPDISNHLKFGVVPIISHEYKWFHSIFKNLMFFDINDIKWSQRMSMIIGYGMLEELYKNIQTYMPEMITENFVSVIVSLCGD